MRLPLASEIDSRDGVSAKDERLTNVLSESDGGVTFSVVRPGLEAVVTSTGNGNGIADFNGEIITVFGTALRFTTALSSIGTIDNEVHDFVQSTL